jgi:hypothetical protein
VHLELVDPLAAGAGVCWKGSMLETLELQRLTCKRLENWLALSAEGFEISERLQTTDLLRLHFIHFI